MKYVVSTRSVNNYTCVRGSGVYMLFFVVLNDGRSESSEVKFLT